MSEIVTRPAHELAVALRRREVSSRELLDCYLERVERLNPLLNAVVTLDPDGAQRAADAADAALARGDVYGPLHGVPMTIKDTYETAGMRTTCGLEAWDHVPERDAEAVRRLREAGAVIFGKTNTPTLAGDWQTFNPIFGTTNNPWDTTRTTGGSSGGSAAALASGPDGARTGQRHRRIDTGARRTGAACAATNRAGASCRSGATCRRRRGRSPTPISTSSARWRATSTTSRWRSTSSPGADGHRATWVAAGTPCRRAQRRCPSCDWRCGLMIRRIRSNDDVRSVLESAATAVRGAGRSRRIVDVPDAVRLYQQFSIRSAVHDGRRSFDMVTLRSYPPMDRPLARTARFAIQRYRDWVSANEKREQLRALIADFFREVDALLMPVAVVSAIAHDHDEPLARRMIHTDGGTRPYLDMFGLGRRWPPSPTCPPRLSPSGARHRVCRWGSRSSGPISRTARRSRRHDCVEELLGGFVPPPGC